MRGLHDLSGKLPDIAAGRRLLAQVLRRDDTPEPVAAWRSAPEGSLRALPSSEKKAYLEALLPLVRGNRRVERGRLRRLYQLFAFLELSGDLRQELVAALHTKLRLAPERLPHFADKVVRISLLSEAVAMAGRSPSAEIKHYLEQMREHLQVRADEASRWTQFFEKLTDVENRVASGLHKRGHIVRVDERKLEIFKKAVAAVGVPAAVLFPLGTVGLSVEGITTGLVALGGGFILPTGVAMLTGLGVAVALGVSTKKMLDMVMPTTDADRVSVDIENVNAGSAEINKILDEATAPDADRKKVEDARAKIGEIIRRIVPLSERDRARFKAVFDHAHTLGERYLDYLEQDRTALEGRNHVGADEIAALFDLDAPVIRPA